MKIPELLAPAGSLASLNAAVRAGANAVYLGLNDFNARRGAENFTLDNLHEACDYAHARSVKVYVTVNTLVITRELKRAFQLIERAIDAGADAFIVQDAGLAYAIADAAGSEFLHISTQMNIHNVAGINAAKALGAGRITLARELSLGEIEHLTREAHALGMEVECFAHGAICVCYSGQCLMSSCIGARSANRGICAQACRLPWNLVENDSKKVLSSKVGPHLLSPKDMCTINDLAAFANAGVDSLKIEGRMKSPEYVETVVRVYREVLEALRTDDSAKATSDQMEQLKASFSRGFTNGLLFGERGNDFMSYDRPNNRGLFVGRVKKKRIFSEATTELEIETQVELRAGDTINLWTKHGGTILKVPASANFSGKCLKFQTSVNCKDVREKDRVFRVRCADAEFKLDMKEPKIPVSAHLKLKLGEPVQFEVASSGKTICVRGDVVEAARTKAVSEANVVEHFARLGQTSFELEDIQVDLDENVGIGFSAIHNLRTKALDVLFAEIAGTKKSKIRLKNPSVISSKKEVEAEICVVVTNADDARTVNRAGCVPYVPALNHKRGNAARAGVLLRNDTQASYPNKVRIMAPIVSHEMQGRSREALLRVSAAEQVSGANVVYCDDIASALCVKERGRVFEIGQFVPVTNDATIELINNLKPETVWLSPELNLKQIEDVASKLNCNVGLFVYGHQRLMTCEHCVLMSAGQCAENCAFCRRRAVSHSLVDRKNVSFPVLSDCLGRSTICNSVPLDLTPNLGELQACGVNFFMIDATLLNEKELARAISRVKEALRTAPKNRIKNSTSGHLFRGV